MVAPPPAGPAQPQPDRAPGRVALLAKPGDAHTGVGRYVQMLHSGLRAAGISATRVAPTVPPLPAASYRLARRLGLDAHTFLMTYPVWAKFPSADVYHFTSQNLASLLLLYRPPGRVVVTVHDIIPYMLRQNRQLSSYRTVADRLFDRLAMLGLRRADALIADSHYTRRCLVEQLGLAAETISVVYLGIDPQRFQPQPVPGSLRQRYELPEGRRYLIYVGSEDPRKNLTTLVRALAEVRRDLPDVELIKVGRAHFAQQRQVLCDLAAELGVRSAIHFLDDVPDTDLPLLYNLADLCVMPSLYEGFGFPVLEAQACGTPVVCAAAASLPELIGHGGVAVSAEQPAALAASISAALRDPQVSAAWRAHCREHALTFRWSRTIRETSQVYQAR